MRAVLIPRTSCFALLISSRKCNKPRLERLHKRARFINIFSRLNFSSKCAFSGDRKAREKRIEFPEEPSFFFIGLLPSTNVKITSLFGHLIYHKFTRVIHRKIKLLALKNYIVGLHTLTEFHATVVSLKTEMLLFLAKLSRIAFVAITGKQGYSVLTTNVRRSVLMIWHYVKFISRPSS